MTFKPSPKEKQMLITYELMIQARMEGGLKVKLTDGENPRLEPDGRKERKNGYYISASGTLYFLRSNNVPR